MTSIVIKNPSGERLDLAFHPAVRRSTLVILGHGLTGNKDRPLLVALGERLSALGWPCMRISFSGNGLSEGRFEDATITKETADLQAVLDTVPDYVRVAYVGHSMGSAVGVLTAAKDLRIQLLVSLAGMVHTADFLEREFDGVTPGEGCMWDDENCPLSAGFVADLQEIGDIFPVAAKVSQPWLLVHGTEDDVIPVQESREAHAAGVGKKQLVEIHGAGHTFDQTSYPEIIAAVDSWLVQHFGAA